MSCWSRSILYEYCGVKGEVFAGRSEGGMVQDESRGLSSQAGVGGDGAHADNVDCSVSKGASMIGMWAVPGSCSLMRQMHRGRH